MKTARFARKIRFLTLLLLLMFIATGQEVEAKKKKKAEKEDPYAEFVWPPPPDEPRIRLVDVIAGRRDVEAESKWKKALLGISPKDRFDLLRKPFAVAIDSKGRLLVTDSGSGALIRFDREERRMDVFGTMGAIKLSTPLGMAMGPDDVAYIVDVALKKVVALDDEGKLKGSYGKAGQLKNPTDVAVGPKGKHLYVTDSKAHQIVVFSMETGEIVNTIGERGEGESEFNFPTSLTFGPDGNLFVVDQLNSRVQVLGQDGEYLDQFGALGVGFGDLVRPKDIAVDEVGFIYISDNAFNNIQIFDADFTLLTFVGEGGTQPGQFLGASGVAVRGDEMAVVDQLGHRLQLFRFIKSKTTD